MKIGFLKFDIHKVISDLELLGGTSFPAIIEETRQGLLIEAMQQKFERRKELVGEVRQDLSGVDAFDTNGKLWTFRHAWQDFLHFKLEIFPNVFSTPLRFTEISLQRYEVGSLGITPHMDWARMVNLICIFSLTGSCRFCLCGDRHGNVPVELDASPGSVILLRAPGFKNSPFRPFHFIDNVIGPRISLGLRQEQQNST